MLVFPHSFLKSIRQRFVSLLLSVTQWRGEKFNTREEIFIFTKDMQGTEGGPEDAIMNVTRAAFEMLTKKHSPFPQGMYSPRDKW